MLSFVTSPKDLKNPKSLKNLPQQVIEILKKSFGNSLKLVKID